MPLENLTDGGVGLLKALPRYVVEATVAVPKRIAYKASVLFEALEQSVALRIVKPLQQDELKRRHGAHGRGATPVTSGAGGAVLPPSEAGTSLIDGAHDSRPRASSIREPEL
jgi:hypothetical protein